MLGVFAVIFHEVFLKKVNAMRKLCYNAKKRLVSKFADSRD